MNREIARAAEWDCSQVLLRFYDAFDAWDYEGMAAMFVEDGVWHRAGAELRGRASIIAEMHRRPTAQVVRHVVTNLIVDAHDPDQAQARFYLTVYRHDCPGERTVPAPMSVPALFMLVQARLVRQPDGWRIAEKRMAREFVAPAP